MERLRYLAKVMQLVKEEAGFEPGPLNQTPLPGTGADAVGGYTCASPAHL